MDSESLTLRGRRVEESFAVITEKLKNGEPLKPKEIDIGVSLLLLADFKLNREFYAKRVAIRHGRLRKDVYDDFVKDDPDDKPITILVPNLFKARKRYERFLADDKRSTNYECPNCKRMIRRFPESRNDCPLCKAPYNYDKKTVFDKMTDYEERWGDDWD